MSRDVKAVAPISAVFGYLQSKKEVRIWLHEASTFYIQGVLAGCDEFMNIVLENAKEINIKTQEVKNINRIMLKGDSITMMSEILDN